MQQDIVDGDAFQLSRYGVTDAVIYKGQRRLHGATDRTRRVRAVQPQYRHDVTGLARSDSSEAVVEKLGARVRRGDLDDIDGLRAAARAAEGVIHLAFRHDLQNTGDLAGAITADLRAIEAMGDALAGSHKPFVGTNATGAMALGGVSGELTENTSLPGGPRIDSENAVIHWAGRGVRSCVVRLPPTVQSDGQFGFASGLIDFARATRNSGSVGRGDNRWPSAETRDVARLYRLALESALGGSRVHAVAESGVTLHEIATPIGRRLEVPVAPVVADEVEEHFGYLSAFVGLDNPTSSRATREQLDWTPTGPGLIAALKQDPVS